MNFNNKGWHPIIITLLAFLIILSIWFFFWPLVECTYAYSWDPLFSGGVVKVSLFIVGGLIFFVTIYVTGKIIL